MAYATKGTGGREGGKSKMAEYGGKPGWKNYMGLASQRWVSTETGADTHTQKLDTPVPTSGYFSYKALTPPPQGTQGNWKQDKSLHGFPSILSLLCAMGQSPI